MNVHNQPIVIAPALDHPLNSNDNTTYASPAIRRGTEITCTLVKGALCGYVVYGINRLWLILTTSSKTRPVTHPLPYVLSGILNAAFQQTIRLTYDIAVHTLGERNKYENLSTLENISISHRLRHWSWKVINQIEKLQCNTDIIFSHIFKIRSTKEIQERNIPDCELYFTEIARQAFYTEIPEIFKEDIPSIIAFCLTEAIGYSPFFNSQSYITLQGVSCLTRVINKMLEIYKKIYEEEDKKTQNIAAGFTSNIIKNNNEGSTSTTITG